MIIDAAVSISKRTKTPEGFLIVPATFARTGIQQYRAGQVGLDGDPMRVVNVYRPPEEVFAAAAMESFGRKPVTNDHPPQLLDSKNAGAFLVGLSSEGVKRDGSKLVGELTITDQSAIRAIESGKVEVSMGYLADYELENGKTDDGEEYEAIQRNIRGNHIAIVDKGRCGPECAIADRATFDCDGRQCDGCPHRKPTGDGTMKITFDGIEHEVNDAAAQIIGELQKRLAAADKRATDAEEKAEENEKEKEKAEGEKDAALTKLEAAVSDEEIERRVERRSNIIRVASRVAPKVSLDGLDDLGIMRAVVKDRTGKDVSEKSADYVQALFDGLSEGGGESERFAQRNQPRPGAGVQDSDDADKARREAYRKSVSDREEAWQKGPQAEKQAS